ncbi:MAG: hypothetical protein R2729_03995 [Bryobacteraceae bacterium]
MSSIPKRIAVHADSKQATPTGWMNREMGVLLISPDETDWAALTNMLLGSPWRLNWAKTLAHGARILEADIGMLWLVICERDLPDGSWKEALGVVTQTASPPLLIVVSSLADANLWSEVLHLGGFDVLAKPLEIKEVAWSLQGAWDRVSRTDHRKQRGPASAKASTSGI